MNYEPSTSEGAWKFNRRKETGEVFSTRFSREPMELLYYNIQQEHAGNEMKTIMHKVININTPGASQIDSINHLSNFYSK